MLDKPEIRYTHVDGVHIAYRVVGTAPPDIFFIGDWARSIEGLEAPHHLRARRFFTSIGRLIEFDPRGIGVSDRVADDDLGRVDDWMADALGVLDAVGSTEMSLVGEGFGSQAAITLAAVQPERINNLTLANGFARATKTDDYPFGFAERDVPRVREFVEKNWGTGLVTATAMNQPALDIGLAGRGERLACSPATAVALIDATFQSDVREVLDRVNVPTLVLHTGDLGHVPLEHSRYLAEHIPGAKLVELHSTLPYWSDEQPYVLADWLTGSPPKSGEPVVTSLVFTDIVDSTAKAASVGNENWQRTLGDFGDFVEAVVAAHQGRVVKSTGDGHLLEFGGPRQAVAGIAAIHRGAASYGVTIRSGLHTGEVRRNDDGDLTGLAVHIAARVCALAGPSELLVSRTVADLLAGSGHVFTLKGDYDLKGVPGIWTLLAVDL